MHRGLGEGNSHLLILTPVTPSDQPSSASHIASDITEPRFMMQRQAGAHIIFVLRLGIQGCQNIGQVIVGLDDGKVGVLGWNR